ncbi:hypothetical protein [Alkalihalophilus marmarensis]|uniref:Uncharacterized protein n=1 Tax=Alkalihalophilus marmarensis DSM 21297 TaxID=1188261 RepID=U6ST97_9BACI|nr:hypothetical protein [Alkalihalophilus marmarensis]ERN54914.1 hypothetical protein A33I_04365 [Alkalihalophilus marmarensis DSM 21297]
MNIETLSSKELIVLISLCGYEDKAKGIGDGMFPNRTEFFWRDYSEKALELLLEKEWIDEDHIVSEWLQDFIHEYIQARSIIRAINRDRNETLIFRRLKNGTWLREHIFMKDEDHKMTILLHADLNKEIASFYQYSNIREAADVSFTLSDDQFAAMSKKSGVRKIRRAAGFAPQEREAFDQFNRSLDKRDRLLDSVSFLTVDEEYQDTHLNKVIFHLPAEEGVWVITYSNASKVEFNLLSLEGWLHTLEIKSQMEWREDDV